MNAHVKALIKSLKLKPHPEGGFYRETWRSGLTLPKEALPDDYKGDRAALTAILFLLPTGHRSKRHRVRSDEVWMHHQGDPVRLVLETEGGEQAVLLGQDPGQEFQATVPGGVWQSALALPGEAGFALVGCVVAPGFDFLDFEMD